MFAELRRSVRQFATRPARFTVLQPQQDQRHAALLQLSMHLGMSHGEKTTKIHALVDGLVGKLS